LPLLASYIVPILFYFISIQLLTSDANFPYIQDGILTNKTTRIFYNITKNAGNHLSETKEKKISW
jgi:hypothetical protein